MGLDLTIYPMEYIPDPGRWQSIYLLSDHVCFRRHSDIFKQIDSWPGDDRSPANIRVKTELVPLDVIIEVPILDSEDYTRKTEDEYGQRLRWCYADELAKLQLHVDGHPYNVAILAFLKALPDKIRILLYWC